MATIFNNDTGGRTLARINGRCLVTATSPTIQFVEENKCFGHTLYDNGRPFVAGYGVSFLAELSGYLSLEPNTEYRITELDSYHRAHFSKENCQLVPVSATTFYRFVHTNNGYYNNGALFYDVVCQQFVGGALKGLVNFRYMVTNDYTGQFAITDIYWKLGQHFRNYGYSATVPFNPYAVPRCLELSWYFPYEEAVSD